MKSVLLYPESAGEKLEFNKVIELLKSKCLGPLGLKYAEKLTISNDFGFIKQALNQTDDFKYLIENDSTFPTENYHDLGEILHYLEINDSVLSELQFLDLLLFLRTTNEIFKYFEKRKEKYSHLEPLLKGEKFEQAPLKAIDSVIDKEGVIIKGVSPELDKIRKQIREKERALDKRFQEILMLAQSKDWLAQGAESVRNGRRVLALNSENKRNVKGIIHDESATGKTVFIEPEETIELSNQWFELKQEEKREIYRILKELSAKVRPHIPVLNFYQQLAGLFDFIRAKALLAIKFKAVMPEFKDKPIVALLKARHPLLWKHLKKTGKGIVPLDCKMTDEERIMVISGPNAGGKSVALKTVGLLQLMLQAGMLVPVHPDSEMGVFDKVFVELGDEQSIENDLSTYSSHLKHMKFFTEKADEKTVCLIDEFGTGTDPKFGGAIAEAVLNELHRKKAFGVVTTHYSNLKIYATHTQGVKNASMLFDKESMQPLFVLNQGQAGSSYAFEIAKKIGLSEDIIKAAEENIDKDYQLFDSLLATMETDKHWVNVKQSKLDEQQKELDELVATYRALKEDLEKNKKQILLDNKQKSLDDLKKMNRKFENLLRDLQEKEASKEAQQKIRAEMAAEREQLNKQVKTFQTTKKAKVKSEELAIGSRVRVGEGTEIGVIEQLRNNKALVGFNNLKTLVDIKEIEMAEPAKESSPSKKGTNIDRLNVEFSPELDLRGKRPEEAMGEVEKLLDKAMLLNFPSLRIIHGRGNGVLRNTVRNLLKKYDIVKEFYSESPDLGGDGVTLVDLK